MVVLKLQEGQNEVLVRDSMFMTITMGCLIFNTRGMTKRMKVSENILKIHQSNRFEEITRSNPLNHSQE